MTVQPAFVGQLEGISVPVVGSPTLLAVGFIALVVTLLLYTERPRITRRTVVSLVPWMVTGATLSVLTATVTYPELVRPAVSGYGAYLTTYVVVVVVWFATLQFSRGTAHPGRLPTHLAAMGVGTATVVVGTLLLHVGDLDTGQLFWLAIAPIASAAIAGIVLLLLGLWYPEAAAYTGMVGGLVVFGHAFWAIATAVAVVATGAHTAFSWAVMNLIAATGLAPLAGLDLSVVWAWGYVWLKLVLAIAAILALTAYTRQHPNRGNLALGLVAAVGVIGGVTALLTTVVGA